MMTLFLLALPLVAAVTVDDVMKFRSAGQPAIAPDGRQVAYVADGAVWVADASGRASMIHQGSAPAWASDGRRLAFLHDGQLWVGTPPAPLTRESQRIDRFRWSPDGSRIAYLIPLPPARQAGPTVVGENDVLRNQIKVVEVATGAVKAVTSSQYSALGYEQWFPDGFDWSPDSRRIVFTRRPHAAAGSHHQGEVAIIDAGGTDLQTVVERPGYDGFPRWSPDGRAIAFISTGRYDWVRISNLFLLDLGTRQVRNVSPEFDESVKEFHWTANGSSIYFVAAQGIATHLFAASTSTGAIRRISSGDGVISDLSITPDGRHCAFVRQNASDPPEIYVSPLTEWNPRRLTSFAAAYTKNWAQVETEAVRWKSFDGMEIEGIVHKPARYQRGTSYPLLVIPHGGPHAVMTNTFPAGETRLFVERGWVVFRPNFRGSGGYGERFLRANLYGWGLGDYQDVMTGVDHLIALGLADADRLAISGASYGGYMTAWTISQTSRFKAAIAGCGITDVASFIRTTDVPDRFEHYLGADDRLYARHSPMTYGASIRTPTLIWHGDRDERVPLMQSRHLYTQLLKNKVPTQLVIYHGEAHGARRADVRRDLLERELRWLERWVRSTR
ncbi:MAG: S9 family peptidase [Bryobacteraceae bacterium]|nr:S9 family peptidase [Bryobacteraceae bacterium]